MKCQKWQGFKFYSLQSPLFPHLLGADVRVAPGAVPVALHRFGVQRGDNPEVFAHAVQQIAWDPQMVAHRNAHTGAHLVLPLKADDATQSIREQWRWKCEAELSCVLEKRWHLPETAWLQHWCRRFWPPRRGRPCSGTPQCLVHTRCWPPRHSSKGLNVGNKVGSEN